MPGDDELGRVRPVDITPDRDPRYRWDDLGDQDEGDERFPRPGALPWTAAWALFSAGTLLFAWTGAIVVQEVLLYSDEASGGFEARRSIAVSATIAPLVLALLSSVAGWLALRRPEDEDRGWVAPLAVATSLLAALTALVFLGLLVYVAARHQVPLQQ